MNLSPNEQSLKRFAEALFKHADPNGVIALRAFRDDKKDDVALIAEPISIGDPQFFSVVSERARQAASADFPVVFCPPVITFANTKGAKKENIREGVAISVDCDRTPAAAQRTLINILGIPTVIVASGGEWVNPDTGEVEDKVHIHWRLKRPTRNAQEHELLRLARNLATRIVGADATNVPLVHPLRWPGSWHRKGEPRLADIVFESDNEVDLEAAVKALAEAAPPEHARPEPRTGQETETGQKMADNIDDVFSALKTIPNDDLQWERWNYIGMATWGATGGSERGLEAFREWSAKSSKNDPEATEARWKHYHRSPPDQLGFGTLVHEARQTNPFWTKGVIYEKNEFADEMEEAKQANKPLILSASQFIARFTPPEYLIDGILQRGYLYSLTARTGHGKTAVDMYISQAVACGQPMHGKEVKPGTVLFLAGENPDDIRGRFIVLADEFKFDIETVKMRFIDGIIDVAASMETIEKEAETIDDLVLVIVDTAAAYFNGDDTNNNTQQGAYARLLRKLTFLPGKPTVLVNCHPVKNATKENLLPMGGSAFLNEVDGNLTLWANADRQTQLHWLGKFRGPEFEPITFEMETVTSDKVVDAKGRKMPSVVAKPISEIKIQLAEGKQQREEDMLLCFIARNKNASIADLAIKCNFISASGNPQKSKVYAMCTRLVEEKLLERRGQKYRITKKGKAEIGWEDEND